MAIPSAEGSTIPGFARCVEVPRHAVAAALSGKGALAIELTCAFAEPDFDNLAKFPSG